MLDPVTRFFRKWKYGEDVVVVSGLPRSGTSMVMSMLEAGDLPILSDHVREADEDNPKGYFEFEKVKDLAETNDKSWLTEARGKSVKVISHLLKELPDDNFYRIIFARRDLQEIIASQNIMLKRQEEANPVEDGKAIALYRKHLVNVRFLVRRKPNLEMLELAYTEVLDDPENAAGRINRFLGGNLNIQAMAAVVDRRLYRNRKEQFGQPSD
ncbi:MAG: sulfotransferase [Gammaproteobacteria bacterium]|nr:sulfotransferase [Gammaproteobacteria bacterium]